MSARHEILGGKVQLYKRGGVWHCSASVGGTQHRQTTKRDELSQAQDVAEDWFLELRGKFKRGELGQLIAAKGEKTFEHAAEQFLREYPVITEGQRNVQYVQGYERRLNKYIVPFFGSKPLSQVTAGAVQEYFLDRVEKTKESRGKIPARNTLHQERVTIRQVLKSAVRHGDLTHLPDLTQPYRNNSKISHRAWFSPDEYKELYKTTRERAKNPPRKDWSGHYEDLHDYVLFMVNTGLRPDESKRIEFRDVKIVDDRDSGETILEIDVRGKRGTGFCKSMPGAVEPFRRVVRRRKPKPTDLVFPTDHHLRFNSILTQLGLKFDREKQRRTFYSLRHTYICLRLMEGADVYQVAKNCRTSVKMIEDFYASHIKNMVDASVINVRKSRLPPAARRELTAKNGRRRRQSVENPRIPRA